MLRRDPTVTVLTRVGQGAQPRATYQESVAAAMCGSVDVMIEPHDPTTSAAANAPKLLTHTVNTLRSSNAVLYGTSTQLGAQTHVDTDVTAARLARSRAPEAALSILDIAFPFSDGWYSNPSPPTIVSR